MSTQKIKKIIFIFGNGLVTVARASRLAGREKPNNCSGSYAWAKICLAGRGLPWKESSSCLGVKSLVI